MRNLVLIALVILPFAFACNTGDRSFTIVNNCNYNVWVAEINQSGGDGWEMNPSAVSELCLSSTWSGRFWPRTSCNFGSDGLCDPPTSQCCSTGNCINDLNQFALKCTHSGVPPVTVAEFTLSQYGYVDYYDVSLVDGASIPVEVVPKDGTFQTQNNGDLYYCGSPGCTSQTCTSTALGTCSWQYDGGSFSNVMQMVDPTECTDNSQCANGQCNTATKTCTCASNTDCHSSEVCGKRQIPGIGVVSACGSSIGWFSANTICSLDPSLGAPLSCTQTIAGQGKYMDLYGCTNANSGSCYSNEADANCCGCPPWSPSGKCQNSNPEWTAVAEPTVALFKNACPTAYSFPYDDITSTFTCGGTSTSNMPGYTITFCPAGSPGAIGSLGGGLTNTTSQVPSTTGGQLQSASTTGQQVASSTTGEQTPSSTTGQQVASSTTGQQQAPSSTTGQQQVASSTTGVTIVTNQTESKQANVSSPATSTTSLSVGVWIGVLLCLMLVSLY